MATSSPPVRRYPPHGAAGLRLAPDQRAEYCQGYPPLDDTAHNDTVLMADGTEVNTLLGGYVLRFLDTDGKRAAPMSTKDE